MEPMWEQGSNFNINATEHGPKCPRCNGEIKRYARDGEGEPYLLSIHRLRGIDCQADQSCRWGTWFTTEEGKAILATVPAELLEWADIKFSLDEPEHIQARRRGDPCDCGRNDGRGHFYLCPQY